MGWGAQLGIGWVLSVELSAYAFWQLCRRRIGEHHLHGRRTFCGGDVVLWEVQAMQSVKKNVLILSICDLLLEHIDGVRLGTP